MNDTLPLEPHEIAMAMDEGDEAQMFDALVAKLGHEEAGFRWRVACDIYDETHGEPATEPDPEAFARQVRDAIKASGHFPPSMAQIQRVLEAAEKLRRG